MHAVTSSPAAFQEHYAIGTSALLSGTYCIPGWHVGGGATRAMTAQKIFYQPILVRETDTFDRIAVEVTTGAGASKLLRLGRYNATSAGGLWYPSTLISDDSTVDANAVQVHEVTISWTPAPGLYFLALETDDAGPTCRVVSTSTWASVPFTGFETGSNVVGTDSFLLIEAVAAGAPALPATATPDGSTHIGFASQGLRRA